MSKILIFMGMILIAAGWAGIIILWKAFWPKRQKSPTLRPGDTVVCPYCGNSQKVPDVVFITKDVLEEYGPDAEKCNACRKLWNPSKQKST